MTEMSLKRTRDDNSGDATKLAVQPVSVEAAPQAADEEDDMVGPMLPPQPKKRKVCVASSIGRVLMILHRMT